MKNCRLILLVCYLLLMQGLSAGETTPANSTVKVVVAADGTGDFKTIQGGINRLPDASSIIR